LSEVGLLGGLALLPIVVALLRHRDQTALLFALISITTVCLGGLLHVLSEDHTRVAVLCVLALLSLAALLPRRLAVEPLLNGLRRSRTAGRLVGALLPSIILLGGCEALAQMAVKAGIVALQLPIVTVMKQGSEDWRYAHIVADDKREPDPVLLWRSRPVQPFTSQGFLGPEVEVPKPEGVFRVICYGDSNTEGGKQGAWPRFLQDDLREALGDGGPRVEVLNAGTAGYSSYQGLMRFEQEVEEYEPDLVLVSFGWNDLPMSVDRPDRAYRPPVAVIANLQRFLLRYSSYRLLMTRLRALRSPGPRRTRRPRVSLPSYLDNMRQFARIARNNGAQVMLLTRPHRATVENLEKRRGWRRNVPVYNQALLSLAREEGLRVFDARKYMATHYPSQFVDECHFTKGGHRLLAARLATEILAVSPELSRGAASRGL